MYEMFEKIEASIKKYIWILYFAKQDPRINWKAKCIIIVTLAYALSPIDTPPIFEINFQNSLYLTAL